MVHYAGREMSHTRHFLGWDEPVLDLAVRFLARGWAGGPLDLSTVLAVVPTRQAGRRLRQHLAVFAGSRGTGVLPPRTVPPEVLLIKQSVRARPASRMEMLAVLAYVLRRTDVEQSAPNLLPAPPRRRDGGWAAGVARQFVELRYLLADAGLTFRDVLGRVGEGFEDLARWEELARLEDEYLDRLHELGLEDRAVAARCAVVSPDVVEGVERVVVLPVPDPVPLALKALEALAQHLPVDVCVHAPAELADLFDEWGRPTTAAWLTREVALADRDIRLVAKPEDQAREAAARVNAGHHPSDVAIGVPDATIIPHLQRILSRSGIRSHDPSGKRVPGHSMAHLLTCLVRLAVTDAYEPLSALLRNPDFLDYASGRWEGERPLDAHALLTAVDTLQNDHLPTTFSAFRRWAQRTAERPAASGDDLRGVRQASFVCECVADLLAVVADAQDGLGLQAVLRSVYEHRRLSATNVDDREFAEAASVVSEQLALVVDSPVRDLHGTLGDRLEMALESVAAARYYPPQADSPDVDLEGWLELHWNDAPHLVLTGLNENVVPQSVVGHPFLPDSLRRGLGLMHNDQRFARDIYLLSAMTESRRAEGGVLALLGKTTEEGDALRPSRLLFRCPVSALPARATALFGEVRDSRVRTPKVLAWKLSPPARPPLDHLSVTAFRDYLQCPFRFYLRRVLNMGALDDRKTEMDALDFGNICHACLESFARDGDLRDSDDADRIAGFLVDQAERRVTSQFGRGLPATLLIQLDAMKQRLAHVARVQAERRAAGWTIDPEYIERQLGEPGKGVLRHGLWIRGKVDRVDRHPDLGVCVIDYKTSDKARPPDTEHISAAGPSAPAFALLPSDGKPRQWRDLQLPLYLLLLRDELGDGAQCAYFAIPKAVSETGVRSWAPDPDVLASAERCAEGIIDHVRNGVFWPPAERVPYDDFESLFSGSATESVDGRLLSGGTAP